MSSKSKSKNQNNLSFIQKCIMLANITQDKNLIVLNSLNFVPMIKLYTSQAKQQIFTYTKVKGGAFILKKKIQMIKIFLLEYIVIKIILFYLI